MSNVNKNFSLYNSTVLLNQEYSYEKLKKKLNQVADPNQGSFRKNIKRHYRYSFKTSTIRIWIQDEKKCLGYFLFLDDKVASNKICSLKKT